MWTRITDCLLVACLVAGATIALCAPDAFAQDAAPPAAVDVADEPIAGGGPYRTAPARAIEPVPLHPAETTDAGTAPTEPTLGDAPGLFAKLLAAARSGDWWHAFGAGLLLFVLGVRLLLDSASSAGAWVRDRDWAGALLTLSTSFALMFGTTTLASTTPTWDDAKLAALFAVVAAGGWSVLYKKLALPLYRHVVG